MMDWYARLFLLLSLQKWHNTAWFMHIRQGGSLQSPTMTKESGKIDLFFSLGPWPAGSSPREAGGGPTATAAV